MKYDWSLIEPYRVRNGHYVSYRGDRYGKFHIPFTDTIMLMCLVADGTDSGALEEADGWDHVSVSAWEMGLSGSSPRIPTWEEMCFVKDRFWDESEWVVQFHPAKADHINRTDYVLHLWKPNKHVLPTPPPICV